MISHLHCLPYQIKDAVQAIIDDCKQSGFKVIFHRNSSYIKEGKSSYAGLFDQEKKVIRVATYLVSLEEWVITLVHEYCHFCQWREQSSIWKNADKNNLFWYWVERTVELPRQVVKKHYKAIRDLELDCELRVERFIKEWNLPLSLHDHTQWINYHMCLFGMMLKTRAHLKEDVQVPHLVRALPDNRIMTKWEFNNPPKKFQELFNYYNNV